jgi:arylsulfatase A-like enzyme
VIETSEHMGNGFHRMNGIFLAYGPDIQAGRHIEGADITDIAPTVLHAMGLPVPDDMDGHVLTAIWRPERQAAVGYVPAGMGESKAADTGYSEAEAAEVEARLAALGYLD